MRRLGWAGLGAGLVAAGVAGWFALVRPVAAPSAEEGQAWLDGLVEKLLRRESWASRGAAALALFPEMGAWGGGDGCVLEWSRRDPRAAVVRYERLELGRMGADPCEAAQFGMLSMTVRPSEGITAGALAARLDARFGPAAMHRDSNLGGSIIYQWLLQDGVFVHVDESARAGNLGEFSVLFMRSYAAPTAIATAAEGEAWMDQVVPLLAGRALADARGMVAVRLAGVPMEGHDSFDGSCPSIFNADLLHKGAIATGQSVLLERAEAGRCEEARFSSLSMRVWQREPVTARGLVERLDARLGKAAVSRDFKWDTVDYRWPTPFGTVVELVETVSGNGRDYLTLRAWREDS